MHNDENVSVSNLAKDERYALVLVLVLVVFSLSIEIAGSYITNSLSLFSDAIHLLTDTSSIVIALAVNFWIAKGLLGRTSELYAVLINGGSLLILSLYIIKEGIWRLNFTGEIYSLAMCLIALGCGLFDYLAIHFLRPLRKSQNIEAVYQHLSADFLSSFGVVAAGLIIYFTQYKAVDGIISCIIGFVVFVSSFKLIKSALRGLL